jgi:hypothetical protein
LPASFPKGTSSKLLSLQNKASNVEPSDIHILLNLFHVNYRLSGKGRELLNDHLFLMCGSNYLKIRSNKTAENVKNILNNACCLIFGEAHHKNFSLFNNRVNSVTPANSRHNNVNTAATIKGKLRILSLKFN